MGLLHLALLPLLLQPLLLLVLLQQLLSGLGHGEEDTESTQQEATAAHGGVTRYWLWFGILVVLQVLVIFGAGGAADVGNL